MAVHLKSYFSGSQSFFQLANQEFQPTVARAGFLFPPLTCPSNYYKQLKPLQLFRYNQVKLLKKVMRLQNK